jgi:protein-tyrosine-phosphatase/DNA-binding transcriptional ArsR family regulator
LIQALTASDYRVQELVDSLGQPANLVSYHLKLLRKHALVQARRSDADGRDIYYSLDLERLRDGYRETGRAIHPALEWSASGEVRRGRGAGQPMRVLFLCTSNSARSQMAEGLMREFSGGQVDACSAGSQPAPVHPLAIATLKQMGIDIGGAAAKHIHAFDGRDFDYAITVCDRMREVCPAYPACHPNIHWSIPDPARVEDPLEQKLAFERTAQELSQRVRYWLEWVHSE